MEWYELLDRDSVYVYDYVLGVLGIFFWLVMDFFFDGGVKMKKKNNNVKLLKWRKKI